MNLWEMNRLIDMRKLSVGISTAVIAGSMATAKEQKTSNAPFLTPSEAVAKMSIPDGFEVSVFAAEPDIGEPIAFTFDGKGRIWVVENYNYVDRRNHKSEQLSRIQILEDTDSDGVFDVKKLFAENLPFSSGIAVGFGGVYLGTPPELLFIADSNGDDEPDGDVEVLLDGWGIQDRHETLNSFIWGPDGWLYGCQGVFTTSLVGKQGTPKEERQYIDGGIWRFHPVRKEFEVFARGLSNPWGYDFNQFGHGFVTCCVIPHLFHIVQGGIYHKQSKSHLNPYTYDYITTIRDHVHRSAHGGARFYMADTFPEEYRNQLFMCNIHEHAVLTDIMVPDGSSYIGTDGENFLPSNDLAWVGFSVEIGPEGGVYILDWHDTDICGNKVNFPDSGRIYRIMPEGAEKIARPAVPRLTDRQLVEMQEHSNDWYVRQARVELHARASAGRLDNELAFGALEKQFTSAKTSEKRLRSLWALHVTGAFDGERRQDLVKLLEHPDEHIRSWSIQLLCERGQLSTEEHQRLVDMAVNDVSAIVRLYLASGLQRLPDAKKWGILEGLSQHEEDLEDNNLPRMLWFGLEPLVPKYPERALQLALNGKIPHLQESVARRLVTASVGGAEGRVPIGRLKGAWNKTLQTVAPGFTLDNVGREVKALHDFRNENVVQTQPKSRNAPVRLMRHLDLGAGKKHTLQIRASYHPHGAWKLRVLAGKQVLAEQLVDFENVQGEGLELDVDLTEFGGKRLDLVVENRSAGSKNAYAFWKSVRVVSE